MTEFYVISGSHGVGKTTVATLVREIMKARGHATATFHHRADKAVIAAASCAGATTRAAWKKSIWHFLPVPLRAWLVAAHDEQRYARSISRRIAAATADGTQAISDRYVYDRLVDLRLHARARPQISAVWVACRLMRKPKMTFLLTDTPARIHERKNELSPDQIATYQNALRDLLIRLRIPHREIAVNGREATRVAEDIAAIIEVSAFSGAALTQEQMVETLPDPPAEAVMRHDQ
ncbi:MAG: hypothetical protein CL573_01810 [Alphaproteobacteria bacterium]|nr:hypothetical protein [Alphaproteobacteria bacterium]HCP00174.1 hypothetical protein [Rhodospirillaceae bacterium]|tara:strand:+ start:81 stop:785 length:705 start_codon:yes stop_codon:yes gene_type:complete